MGRRRQDGICRHFVRTRRSVLHNGQPDLRLLELRRHAGSCRTRLSCLLASAVRLHRLHAHGAARHPLRAGSVRKVPQHGLFYSGCDLRRVLHPDADSLREVPEGSRSAAAVAQKDRHLQVSGHLLQEPRVHDRLHPVPGAGLRSVRRRHDQHLLVQVRPRRRQPDGDLLAHHAHPLHARLLHLPVLVQQAQA